MCLRAGLCCGSGPGHSCVPCWPRGSSRRCAHHCRWRHPELRAHREGPGSRGIHCDVWLHAGWHHRGTRCAALLAQHAQWLHQTDSAACAAAHLVHCLPPSNCTACTVTACKAAFVAAEPDKSRGVGHCHALRQPTKRCSGTGLAQQLVVCWYCLRHWQAPRELHAVEVKVAKSQPGGRYLQSYMPREGVCLLHRARRTGHRTGHCVHSRSLEVLCMPCTVPHTGSILRVRGMSNNLQEQPDNVQLQVTSA